MASDASLMKRAKDIDKIMSDHYQGTSTEGNVSEGFSQSTPQRGAPALDGVAHLSSMAHLTNSPG